jgi:hypothetical protein
MPSQPQRSLFRDEIVVDVRGPGEWIVGVPRSGNWLHVYRIGPADWLVSEVGRANEGRGRDLRRALASLATAVWPAEWWQAIARALDVNDTAP